MVMVNPQALPISPRAVLPRPAGAGVVRVESGSVVQRLEKQMIDVDMFDRSPRLP
jgi:hypothetical protein